MIALFKRISAEVLYVAVAALAVSAIYRGVSLWLAPESMDYIQDAEKELATRPPIFLGSKLSIPQNDLVRSRGDALVVVISPDCVYCSASAPFFKRLVASAQGALPLVIALPTAAKGRKYASSVGFQNQKLIDWKDLGPRPVATPTLILIKGDGTIRGLWVGKLNESGEAEVFAAMRDPGSIVDHGAGMTQPLLSWSEVRRLMSTESLKIVSAAQRRDFRTRRYPVPVLDIPADEIAALAPAELARDGLYALDCSAISRSDCGRIITTFNGLGFRTIGMSGWKEE